jgi:hypothetical protein
VLNHLSANGFSISTIGQNATDFLEAANATAAIFANCFGEWVERFGWKDARNAPVLGGTMKNLNASFRTA